MKRLLCVLSSMNAGGAETFLMKIYRQLDRNRYQMDFCVNVPDKCFYEDEIMSMGGRVYRIPAKSQNQKEFARQLGEVVQKNQYTSVLRITSNAMGFMDLKIAKKAGASICSVRSSNSSDGAGWKPWLAHRLGRLLYERYVDVKFAPSDLAAKYTFGKKAYNEGNVTILHNAVDLNVFRYDEMGRIAVREEFGVERDTLLVGHVGRFMTQKNHGFLLDIFGELLKKKPNSKLLLVGKGELEQQVREQVATMGITEQVIFAGIRSDIPQLMSAMDMFLFPSLYEGMPNTVIEAQATGLPCLIADTITREANITGLVDYLPLSLPAEKWAEASLAKTSQTRKDTHCDFISNGYDIRGAANTFVKLVFGE